MKKIDKYVLKTYIGPFCMTFLVVVFIFLMQFVWKYVDDMVGKGLEWSVLFKLLLYTSCTFIPMALPLALLLSGLMTFGNLGERYELVAMKSAGIPLYRIMRPLILFALGCSMCNFFLSNNLVPYATFKSTMLLRNIRSQKPALNIDEKVFYKGIDNYVIRIGEKEKDNQTIHDVLIYDHSKGFNYTTVTHAKKGHMYLDDNKQNLIFTLYDGYIYDENLQKEELPPDMRRIMRGTFKSQQIRFDLSSFQFNNTTDEMFKNNYSVLNVKQLDHFIDSIRNDLQHGVHQMGDNLLQNMRCIQRYCLDSAAQARYKEKTEAIRLPQNASDRHSRVMVAQNLYRQHASIINFATMTHSFDEEQLWRYEIEWHRKYSLCAACLILFFIGAPLGSIMRKGGIGIPLTISIFIFVIYWVISTMGERMARVGTLSAAWGMWLSSLILLPVGIFLIYKSTQESHWSEFRIWKKAKLLFSKKSRNKDEDPANMQ